MAVTKTELHKVITKLDDVKIEVLRLRADLLPEERPTASKKRQIRQGRREIERQIRDARSTPKRVWCLTKTERAQAPDFWKQCLAYASTMG